jgi:K+-sensing histidine kinase KdpD
VSQLINVGSKLGATWHRLAANALRYTPQDGRVKVRLKTEKQLVIVAVSDTGPGIARDDLPRIFDRFASSTQHKRQIYMLGIERRFVCPNVIGCAAIAIAIQRPHTSVKVIVWRACG